MTSDPFNFGPPPDNGPDWQPGAPPRAPFGVGGNPVSAASHPDAAVFGAPTPSGPLTVAKPPVWLLFVAAALALVAGVVALLLAAPTVAIVCWVLAGPVAIGLLALFVVKDTFARSSGLYAAPGWVKPMHFAVIALCLVCILIPALRIADWVGHL